MKTVSSRSAWATRPYLLHKREKECKGKKDWKGRHKAVISHREHSYVWRIEEQINTFSNIIECKVNVRKTIIPTSINQQ